MIIFIFIIVITLLQLQAIIITTVCDCSEILYQNECQGYCTWSSADFSCAAKIVDCTTYTTQPTCDAQPTCAWNDSTSKCATFTACADYTVTVADQCYYKDSTCVPGTAGTDGKIPCKTGSVACGDFKNSADCNGKNPTDTTTCWFKSSTCISYDTSKCSGITDRDVCENSCKWTTDNKCAAYTCADMPSADFCLLALLDDFSGYTICNWNTSTSKCEELNDVSSLYQSNCQQRTLYGYHWDGSGCSKCTGQNRYAQTLIKISQNSCDCTEIVQSGDCKGGCTWSSADSSCADTKIDCTKYTTQPKCDAQSTCAWNDSISKCATFTDCADYTEAVANLCYDKDSTCVPGTAGTDGKIPCKTGSMTCENFKNAKDCNGKRPSDTAICYFKANTCTQFDVSKCQQITDKNVCEVLYYCKWGADNKCSSKTCADFKTADTCLVVLQDDFSGVNLCNWNTSTKKCENLANASSLTSANCYDQTSGHYFWNGSTCIECSGQSSNGYILAFIGFIIIVML